MRYYETSPALFRLLLDHYGMPDHVSPTHPDAFSFCGRMTGSVEIMTQGLGLPATGRALEIGCAVGGCSFALRRHFAKVIGIDLSRPLLEAARTLQRERELTASYQPPGFEPRFTTIRLPGDTLTDGIEFLEADACAMPPSLGTFDFVYMEKMLDRLPDPEACLRQLPGLVTPGGCFAHISPYWWLDEYTKPEKRFGTPEQAFARMEGILRPHFELVRRCNVPFFILSHITWFSYGLAEALVWRRVKGP